MPDGTASDAGVLAAILHELLALRAEVRALRRPADARADDAALAALAQAIARALGGNVWTLVDLAHLAALGDDALAQALAPWPSLRAAGRCVAGAAKRGRPIGGYLIERVGRDRDGGVWRLSPDESHTLRCASSSQRSRCAASITEEAR